MASSFLYHLRDTTVHTLSDEQYRKLVRNNMRALKGFLRKVRDPVLWMASIALLLGMATFPHWAPELGSSVAAVETKHVDFDGTGKPVVYTRRTTVVVEQVDNNASKLPPKR